MLDFGIFGQEFENNIVVFEMAQSMVEQGGGMGQPPLQERSNIEKVHFFEF